MEILKTIQIFRANSNQIVEAEIIRLTVDLARKKIDSLWWNIPNVSKNTLKSEGDHHWVWENIVRHYENDVLSECVAILSPEDYLEGAMIYQFNAKSELEPNKGSIYVGWLASAPHNRNWLVNQTFYKGVGTVLLYWAVRESYETGLEGRISLESLPTPSTIEFYKNKGFVRTDLNQPTNGLVKYELPKTAAADWLRKNGDLLW